MLDTIASEEDMLHFLKDPYANVISDATYPTGGNIIRESTPRFQKFLWIMYGKRRFFLSRRLSIR